ncbi:hypothetical protein F383_29177 [Gossypium arboreum]|uniref:Uncharacterized protein n=1 Tax=Gossypium arboreum TaxID=29729 RepID=A0A0B0MYK8_GOSAR|nr:hypothetical protein F383_29177 [Gossypium arboreum]
MICTKLRLSGLMELRLGSCIVWT